MAPEAAARRVRCPRCVGGVVWNGQCPRCQGTGVVTSTVGERHQCIELLTELLDSLPTGHKEKPGVIRAIEVLRTDG